MSDNSLHPNENTQNAFDMYGRIKEGVHVAGYSFERACSHLEWLLDEGRWKLGGRFDDVNKFLESIKLDQFRIITDKRQRIAKRIKELQPEASQRAIAKVVGVDEKTVRNDLRPADKSAPNKEKAAGSVPSETVNADKSAPKQPPPQSDLSGSEAAKTAKRQACYKQRKEQKSREREQASVEASDSLPNIGECYQLNNAACRDALNLEAGSIDTIITDPPYPKEFLDVFDDLADVGAHVLKPGGLALVMVGQSYLPDIIEKLSRKLSYHWTMAYLTPGGQAVQQFPRKVNAFWKPVLIYSKGEYAGDWFGDVSRSATNDNDKNHHHWGQSESGMYDLMKRFVKQGDTVLDPFLGGGTTAVVALDMGARFIGYDIDPNALATTRSRIGGSHVAVI